MKKETLKNIFDFLEDNEGKRSVLWKLFNNEPLREEELYLDKDVHLSGSKMTSLPKGLKVAGLLELSGCTSLTSLPEGLEVRGIWLDLENTSITSLPKGLKVWDSLYIAESPLAKLSDEELREMVKPGFIKGRIYR